MKRYSLLRIVLLISLCSPVWAQSIFSQRLILDLSGKWDLVLDPNNRGIASGLCKEELGSTVLLPGTTDTNCKGIENTKTDETTLLSRKYRYAGPAWYSKEINLSPNWIGKQITLFLERTRPSMVWIDGKFVDKCDYLSVPHRYDLTTFLTPGKHRLTIRVDNGESIPQQIRSNSHACTESTQTNWNGIIGRMELQGVNPQHIASMEVYPLVDRRSVLVKLTLSRFPSKGEKITFNASAFNNSNKKHEVKPMSFLLTADRKEYEFLYPLGKEALLWSEFSPSLYRLTASLGKTDKYSVNFGLREFKAVGKQFAINHTKTFLRGKHDACVFPLSGHSPMNVDQWIRHFKTCKAYGVNHVRFHSWCPPAACFEAADIVGIYLQPELTIWGGFNKKETGLMDFLLQDGEQIQKEYSNHPSFVLFALGNELGGDVEVMKFFIDRFRSLDMRHLYSYGSNNFLGSKGCIPGEDFLVTCKIGEGERYTTHTRASFSFADADEGGFLNNTYPNSLMNFDGALTKSAVPVIGHETGQFQIYPNFGEIKKYTGVLVPWNLEIFRKRLEEKGMANQSYDFFRASGTWSVLLYRADIEMNLRTRDMAGFQLLDLQDYPGQGSAYVGVLDAFMDSKGLITPQEWRNFCSEVVPLFATPKFCWTEKETLTGKIDISNYSQAELEGKILSWRLVLNKKVLKQGEMNIPRGNGLLQLGQLLVKLPSVKKACKAMLELNITNSSYKNNYPLWIYPENNDRINFRNVLVATQISEEVVNKLQKGGNVLLMPNQKDCKESTVGGLFQTDYWNFRMFKTICDRNKKSASPGTLGLFMDPKHPMFKNFPTEFHTNWQWYSIIKQSYPFILDYMPIDYQPIVQVIDNIERNHKLGIVFEFNVEKGKLLVCMADLVSVKDKPEVRQFYNSMMEYMESDAFRPVTNIGADTLRKMFSAGVKVDNIKELNNISY